MVQTLSVSMHHALLALAATALLLSGCASAPDVPEETLVVDDQAPEAQAPAQPAQNATAESPTPVHIDETGDLTGQGTSKSFTWDVAPDPIRFNVTLTINGPADQEPHGFVSLSIRLVDPDGTEVAGYPEFYGFTGGHKTYTLTYDGLQPSLVTGEWSLSMATGPGVATYHVQVDVEYAAA